MVDYLFGGGVEDRLTDTSGNAISTSRVGFYLDSGLLNRVTALRLASDNTTVVSELTTDSFGYWPQVYIADNESLWAASLDYSAPARQVTAHNAVTALKGAANGLATLGGAGRLVEQVPAENVVGRLTYAQLPADLSGGSTYALKTEVPSIEDTFTWVVCGNPAGGYDFPNTASREIPLGPAPYPITILGFMMMFQSGITLSATNYWTFNLQKEGPGGDGVIASKSTADEAILIDRGWNFDATLFNATFRQLSTTDTLHVQVVPTGIPGTLGGPITAAIRYART